MLQTAAVNSMHDSYTPLGGLVALVNIQLGEIIFGGVGSGFYGMLLFAIIAVFIAGLMVGRTPEYLGKKLEAKEVKMAMLAILILPLSILGFTALASVLDVGLSSRNDMGPHGFSEILYAFTSGTGNNGSAFAGLNANTPFYNTTIGLSMLVGRFLVIVPMMAVAGSLAAKKSHSTFGRNLSHAWRAVHRFAHGCDCRHGRAHLLSCACTWPTGRTLRNAREQALLRPMMDLLTPRQTGIEKVRKGMPVATLMDTKIIVPAIMGAFRKLHPRHMISNPVMFVVEIVATLTTFLFLRDLVTGGEGLIFSFQINLWLWFTVLFANFAEAVAEGRGKAQAATLRKARTKPARNCWRGWRVGGNTRHEIETGRCGVRGNG